MKCLLILFAFCSLCNARFLADDDPDKLIFSSCVLPRWKCVNESNDLSSYVSKISYQCQPTLYTLRTRNEYRREYGGSYSTNYWHMTPGENITLDLSDWTKLTLSSLKVKDCFSVILKMHTDFESNIEKLILNDIDTLNVHPPKTSEHIYHPREIFLNNVTLIPELPARAITDNLTEQVIFQDVKIESISQEAISLHGPIKAFTLENVTFGSVQGKSISVKMEKNSKFLISSSNFPSMESNSISVEDGFVIIRNSSIYRLQEASFVIKAVSLILYNNSIDNFNNALFVDAPRISIKENVFQNENALKLVHWNGYERGANRHQVVFNFVDNSVTHPKQPSCVSCVCTSKSAAFVDNGNCTTRTSITEYFSAKNKNGKAMLFNLLVCGNNFDFEIPSEWYPKTKNVICTNENIDSGF